MNNISAISNLKLRVSAGQTGNQEVGNFITQTYISNANVLLANGYNSGLYPGSTGNDNLKWETTTQFDIGLDIGLFKNRVSLEVDYYHKNTEDMLFNLPLPQSTTTGSAWVNFGSVRNTGIELSLNTVNFQSQNLPGNSLYNIIQ
ncbi:MAG: TonB-dependent receptor [Bacteroidales bacterium]|nr:TonB-dependent receptor [Bacteroidales bacterium]